MSCSLIEDISKSTNNYCIYISSNNPEHCIQFELLSNNIKQKHKDINFYFLTSKEIIKELKLSNNFIDEEFFNKNRKKFGCVEELSINPKTNPVEDFCKKNEIDFCVSTDCSYSTESKIVVFTKSYSCRKSLLENDLEKIKKIFGHNLIINPTYFASAKYVIGPECWQIFDAASKKIPTFIISNNGNYVDLFLKMFPKHKKLEL